MKKRLFTLLLLLCPMLIAGMASASQLYLIGDSPFGNGWTTNNVKAMTLESDGVTNTFIGTSNGNNYFAICTGPTTNSNDWTTMNGQLRYGWTGAITDGQTVTLTQGEYTTHITETGDWKITVNSETWEMTVEKLSSAPDTYAMVGGFNNWSLENNTLEFTFVETTTVGDVYTASIGEISGQWKVVKNHSWGNSNELCGGVTNMEVGQTYNLSWGGSNCSFASTLNNVTFTLTVFANGNGGSIKIEGTESDVPHTYQIAGTGDLGLSWTPSDNPMTEENGTWTLTKSGLTLFPGNYAYKLVQDGSTWIPDGMNNDHQLTISEIGVYDVVFTMTEPTDAGYTAVATKTAGFTFSVAGNNGAIFGNAWWENADGDAANAMTLTDGKYVITKTGVELTAGEFQYRVRINGAYTTDQGFAYNANGIFNIEGIGSNKVVTVAQDGKYDITITFDPAAKTVTETLVREAAQVKDYTVTFVNSGNWEGDIYVWAWREGKNFTGGEWPGKKATKTENKAGNFDIWTYTFEQLSEDDLPTSIIFSANGAPQTQDDAFADNGEYWGVETYGLEGVAFGGWKDGSTYRGIENLLTKTGEGVYTYTAQNVALEVAAYPYRVSKNGKWVTNTGIGGVDGNKEFVPEAAGNYDITVTLTNTDSKKDVEVTLTPAGVVTEAKYYIVGEEDLLGVAWAADEANELTFNGDAWTLTKSNLTLTARDYEYKLLKVEGETQTWIPDTNENKILTIQEDGEYNVYFTMAEPTDNGYYALAEKIDEPAPVVTTTVYYVDQQGWGNPLMQVWGGTTTTNGLNQAKSSKEVKAWGNTYTQFEYEVTGTPDGILFAKDNTYSEKTSDMAFVPGATYAKDGDEPISNGIFLFTDDENIFQPAEDVNVNVTASYARKFDVGKACTVVLPFALGADKAAEAGKFYRLTSIEDGIIHGESEVPAPYVPYIFEPASEYPFTNIFVGQLPKAQVNTINAAGNAKMNFALEQTTLRSDAETAYYGWSATDGFVKLNVGLANPMRAWIEMPAAQAGANNLIWMDDVVTGINMINMEIQNGTKVYDLQGRQVTNPTARGIYIVNGKKYVVK